MRSGGAARLAAGHRDPRGEPLAHCGEPAAISRTNRGGQMARRPRTVDPRRCAGIFVQWTGRLSGARHSRPAGGVLGLAGRAGRRYASRSLPRYPLPASGAAGSRGGFRPELYVLPDENIVAALQRRITELQSSHPGVAVEPLGSEWRIAIPDALRIGHDAGFAAFTRRFLAQVADPASLPARDRPNFLAKYRVTTGAVAVSRR